MSALPPEADMLIVGINVCYVPKADIVTHRTWARHATRDPYPVNFGHVSNFILVGSCRVRKLPL